MVDAKRLLADLKKLRKRIEDDLRLHHLVSPGRAAVEAEWQQARDQRRTADTFETFWSAALDQAAVHWLLGLVFLRFLEDNRLLDRPLLSGPGERLDLAVERQRTFFRARPHDSDAEFLLETFAEAAGLPGLSGLYDPAHNPLFRLPVSGDGAMALLAFFRDRVPETGALVHDFSDPDLGTRFLGDLYQDLSEDARKRFALLQTPDFVEDWILSRTLDPAIGEFGIERVRMIDPTCGSGHFLLGGFARLLAQWQRIDPDAPPQALAQRALDGVTGIDLNPFAVEIARFRLLLAALRACNETRLAAAPDFAFSLAVGDSLFHGTHFFVQHDMTGVAEGFGRQMKHHYVDEDTAKLDRLLGRQYHAVVGNPPYITPKDAAMRDAYREIYESCHMKYGLGAPFTERFFDLALTQTTDHGAGYVGLIVANSFMKREFGKKLIQTVLPRLDVTHVVDCSGAYIPGHGTPTVILFGRNRRPVESVVRTVRGVRGEPSAPENPAAGLVWSAITAQTDLDRSESPFISTEDTPRTTLNAHPWNMGGGGSADVQALIEEDRAVLDDAAASIGITAFTLEDDLFLLNVKEARRSGIESSVLRQALSGDEVRDWSARTEVRAIFPYDSKFTVLKSLPPMSEKRMWIGRTGLANNKMFGGRTKVETGLRWYEFGRLTAEKLRSPLTITFGEVATHNHFVLDRGGKIFNRTAPIIKLPDEASENDHLGLLGLLNSSTACFWLKQVCYPKGGDHVGQEGARVQKTKWDERYAFNATNVERFPLSSVTPVDFARALDTAASSYASYLPSAVCARAVPTRAVLDAARESAASCRAAMIALQEELDWHCYRLYALHDDPPEHLAHPLLCLGERAFEIVMARRMAAGDFETAWFIRHGSTPITDLPVHWPADYRSVVERRIEIIESDPTIGLIESPEYKRRWSSPTWEEMKQDALRTWLLDRLEDRRYWPEGDPRLTSTRGLADAARDDPDFLSVAELYAGRAAANLDVLVADLVVRESVPFLAALRYSETGLRKRADWEATWDKQRHEDLIDAEVAAERDRFLRETWAKRNKQRDGEVSEAYAARMAIGLGAEDIQKAADALIATEAKRRKQEEVGEIPVPPKYRTPDFASITYWSLRGGLDVPKERFISFPHCARDADDSLPVLWAGYDHKARAQAIATWFVERRQVDGWPAHRLVPLLAGLLELVPWLCQWHNDIDPDMGIGMGDFYAGFVAEQARELELTEETIRAWTPPAATRRPRRKSAAA